MEEIFKFMTDSRRSFIDTINGLCLEELNEVPQGYNNNIIWNFGHIIVSTPLLCYVRTGIWEDGQAIKYVNKYKKGTKPNELIGVSELEELKARALSSVEQLKKDYQEGVFTSMQPFNTSTYQSSLYTMEDVLITCVGHDNLHYGYAKAIIKSIKNK